MALTRKSQKVHRVRFATVRYPNIYLFKNKRTLPHKINFHTIIIKKLLQNVITQRKNYKGPTFTKSTLQTKRFLFKKQHRAET